jgi:hypothetical protein
MSAEPSSSAAPLVTVEQKLTIAKQKKDTADQAFKLGKVQEGKRLFILRIKGAKWLCTSLARIS